jgi:hypothetical protein
MATQSAMHETQTAYSLALAVHEQNLAEFNEACRVAGTDYYPGMTDVEFDAAEDTIERLRIEHRLHLSEPAVRLAEEAMMRWAVDHTKMTAPAMAPQLEEVFQKARRLLKYRRQMIDIALRLCA